MAGTMGFYHYSDGERVILPLFSREFFYFLVIRAFPVLKVMFPRISDAT